MNKEESITFKVDDEVNIVGPSVNNHEEYHGKGTTGVITAVGVRAAMVKDNRDITWLYPFYSIVHKPARATDLS
jgi:hypothetical protein